jgi:hypothetical protein
MLILGNQLPALPSSRKLKDTFLGYCPNTGRDKNPIYVTTFCGHDLLLIDPRDSKEEMAVKMFSELLANEEINAATALVLSGTLIVLMSKGPGPVSPKRIVSRVLSNPVSSGSPAL